MNDHFCIYCGAALPEGADVCPQCGRAVYAQPAAPEQPAEGSVPGQADAAAAPEPGAAAAQEPAAEPAAPAAESAAPKAAEPQSAAQSPEQPVQNPEPPRPKYMPAGAPAPRYGNAAQGAPYAAGAAPRYAPYQPPVPELLGVGSTLGTLVVAFLPLIGWILLLVWAFDSTTAPNKKNLSRALLFYKLIGVAVGIVAWVLIFVLVLAGGNSAYGSSFFSSF